MNILFLHSAGDTYGSGKILIDIIRVASKRGDKCILILPENGALNTCFSDLAVEILVKDIGILRRKYMNPLGIVNRLLKILWAQVFLYSIIKDKKIDLVYSNTTAVVSPTIITKLLKLQHIWHVHEILFQPKIFVKFISYLLNKYSACCVVVSRSVKEHWIKSGVDSTKIKVIYNGIDSSKFQSNGEAIRKELNIKNDDYVVGMIARVHYWKGQDYFLEIASKLKMKIENIKFIMVGDIFPGYEYLYNKLDDLKNKYHLNDIVYDLGFRIDVANILSGLDIFVLPSTLPDPLPTTVLEAMCAGKPVVATEQGGASEMVVNNKTGFLVPFDDADYACEKILYLLGNREMMISMGKEGHNRVRQLFSPEAFERNINILLDEVKGLY